MMPFSEFEHYMIIQHTLEEKEIARQNNNTKTARTSCLVLYARQGSEYLQDTSGVKLYKSGKDICDILYLQLTSVIMLLFHCPFPVQFTRVRKINF